MANTAYYTTSYSSTQPKRIPDEGFERKRSRIKALPKVEQVKQGASELISGRDVVKIIMTMLIIGIMLITVVFMNALATEIKYDTNQLKKENALLENEIAMLGIQIEGANSIESVEDYAINSLNMRYPKASQCIYIEDAVLIDNLAEVIREKAYQ